MNNNGTIPAVNAKQRRYALRHPNQHARPDGVSLIARAESRYALACREADKCDSKDDARRLVAIAQHAYNAAVRRINGRLQRIVSLQAGDPR